MSKLLSLVSYNVLADSYIKPEWYPHTPAQWLDPTSRHPALLAELQKMDTDILALQEVEAVLYDRLAEGLEGLGYVGHYEPKGRKKPDGCATFVRGDAAGCVDWLRLDYDDGDGDEPVSGHLALIAILDLPGQRLGVANTHLKWAPDSTPRTAHRGARQLDQLARACAEHDCTSWVVCGDLNCGPESAVLDGLRAAGFVDAHAGLSTPTCNANRQPRKLDHVFVTANLDPHPAPIDTIDRDTPLPSSVRASDHLPVGVTLRLT